MNKKSKVLNFVLLIITFIPLSSILVFGASVQRTKVYTSTDPSKVKVEITNDTFDSSPDDPSAPDQEIVQPGSFGTEGNNEEISTFAIIGGDDRKAVSNNTGYPNRCIAFLKSYWPDGDITKGTAFIVGRNKAFTAAHCTYNAAHGGYATNLRIWPGFNTHKSPKAPYGYYDSSYFLTWSPWTDYRDRNYDYSVISFNNYVGDRVGYFSLRARPKKSFIGTNIYVSGYPEDKKRLLYRALGQITGSSTRIFTYNTDMMRGESGAPIYRKYSDLGWTALGVNTTEFDTYNQGARITKDLINLAKQTR